MKALGKTFAEVSKPSFQDKMQLSDRAYFLIQESILRGKVRPGTVLSRRKLADEFGMSMLPVSEALQRLESEGLVEIRARAGTRVRSPEPEEIRGRYIIREALEAQAARLCCQCATFPQRLELVRMAQDLDTLFGHSAGGSKDEELQFVVNTHHVNFHISIADFAGCPELKRAIERSQMLVYNWRYAIHRLPPQSTQIHTELAHVLVGDNPVAADEAMRKHVQHGLEETLQKIIPFSPSDWRPKK